MGEYKLITDISKINLDNWREFVFNHPLGNVFQSPEMLQAYKGINNFKAEVICVVKQNVIIGILLYVIQKEGKGILSVLLSRSIIMGGPLAIDNDLKVIDLLLKEYKKNIGRRAIYTQFRNLFDIEFAHSIYAKNGFIYDKHLNILIDLTQAPEKLKSNISKNRRGNISKSLNKGACFIEIKDKPKYLECVNLINKTYKRIGLPCPGEDYFLKFYDELHPKNILKSFALEVDKKLVGTRLELCYKDTVYDWWAGADNKYKNFHPNDVIPFQILVWGHNNGYKTFDFGGAGKPGVPYGVRDHKMKFGGELVEYGRYLHIHKPFLYYMGIIGLKFYKIIKHGIFHRKK